jgi:hypothetical protein
LLFDKLSMIIDTIIFEFQKKYSKLTINEMYTEYSIK